MSYETMADNVVAFADSLGLKTFSLAGYCFGGRVASVIGSKYPERVEDIILIETSFGRFEYALLDEIFEHA
jgi:pimeloyl-ACP methyl ester carboxylesterase